MVLLLEIWRRQILLFIIIIIIITIIRGPVFESCAVVLKPWALFSLFIAPVHSAV